jgi:threonine dehydratase
VRLGGDTVETCIAAAREYAAAREHAAGGGAVYVPPFDDPVVIAGQGTVGLEIAAESPELGAVAVPVGGGGLVSGVAAALAGARPGVPVVGVEAKGAAVMQASLAAGRCVTLDTVTTMADGIANRAVSELTLAHVRAYVDDVVTVSEEEISSALILLLERSKAVVEPAGAVALAAALAGRLPGTGPVAVVLSGGNVDPLLLVKLIHHGLSAAGRYMVLRVVLGDRPGTLAALVAAVAAMGLNILEVAHQRAGRSLGVYDVEVVLTIETRGHDHREEAVAALRSAGFAVDVVA